MIKCGATIWARQTLESDIFFYKPDKWFKIWFYIVNKVSHKDTKLFKRGEGLFTYKNISDNTKATTGQIDKCIRFLKKSKMATTRKTTRGVIVFALNYDLYQDMRNYKSDTPVETRSKRGRNAVDTIYKNNKNEKNEKNDMWGNVVLSESEHSELKKLIGSELKEYVERLNNYIGSTGKTYKSHYYTIRSWYNADKKKRAESGDYGDWI